MAKTKKPTGLSITRSGSTWTFSWKIADNDYGAGQQLKWRVNGGSWSNVSVLATDTSATVTSSATTTARIVFKVRGKRKNYKNGDTTVKSAWSAWSTFKWTATAPQVESLEYENTSVNSGVFTWEAVSDDTGSNIYKQMEIQTAIGANASPAWSSSWTSTETSGSNSYTESSTSLAQNNLLRSYRVRAVGPGGASAWQTVSHAYGTPKTAVILSFDAFTNSAGDTATLRPRWNDAYDALHPIDTVTIQYAISEPTDVALTAPSSGWTDAIELNSNNGANAVNVEIDDAITSDECMWGRIQSDHDGNTVYTDAVLIQRGKLSAPSSFSATPDTGTGSVSFTFTSNTTCSVAKHAIFCRPESNPGHDRIVLILEAGVVSGSATVSEIVGASTTCFGVYAFLGNSSDTTISSESMTRSDTVLDTDIAPTPPTDVAVTSEDLDGAVRLSWGACTWSDATQIEITWADYDKAWESTEQPSSYIIDTVRATSWIVKGLTVGKTWYFRVRFAQVDGDDTIEGPWSSTVSIDLTSVPDDPVLTLSKTVVNQGGSVTARWAFSSSDGTTQAYAEIRSVEYSSSGTISYGDLVAKVSTAQTLELALDWTADTTYYFAVRVASTSGQLSSYSAPVSLYVTDPVSVSISSTSLSEDDSEYTLTELPLTVTATGAGSSGTTILTITRAAEYHLDRPDETDSDGYEGETIASYTQTGEDEITIELEDLLGSLDDGALYYLNATAEDSYGQTDTEQILFKVAWTHKAEAPSVTILTDIYQRITKITPVAPSNWISGDVCDIYRLTVDKPELIYEGADFGTTYVDPYPGFGEVCGHRLVTRTANGDYTTDSGLGWYDSGYNDGDVLYDDLMVIDVDGEQIELPYELSLSNRWDKDFKRTKYLGGSIQGDWNPAVTRDLTANTVLIRSDDLDKQVSMRGLAGFAGIAHVRTPDGSSFPADVQIQENQSFDSARISYTLTIKAIDPEEPDGMTLTEWDEAHPIGE